MKFLTVLLCIGSVLALPYDIIEDEEGQQFYLVPLETQYRQRRDVKYDVAGNGNSVHGKLGYEGNVFTKGNHRVDATPFVSKQFNPNGPTSGGGSITYTHIPSDSKLGVTATKYPSFGTNVNVGGQANLWKHGNTRLDAQAGWNRNYGGPFGASKPQFGGGIQLNHQFGGNGHRYH